MMAVWSTVPTSSLVGALRLDAEFWQPAYLDNERAIRSGKHVRLGSLVTTFKKGIFYILAREYTDAGVPFYRSSNVGAILPEEDGLAYITPAKHRSEHKTALGTGDLMMVKTGRSGASVVLTEQCNVSQDVIAIKVSPLKVNPFFLAVFLNTRFGVNEMDRWFQGQVQPHLSLEDARKMWIALVTDDAQTEIESLIKASASSRIDSRVAYDNAESSLESALGINKETFLKSVGYSAQFSDIETSRRADALHFQPRFKQLIEHLSRFRTTQVRSVRSYNRRGIQPIYLRDGDVDVINSQHLGPRHIDYDGLEATSKSTFLLAPEAHVQQNDLLIYTTGAYVGRTNVYLSESPAMASNHVNILRLRPDIDAAYMALVFQSVVGQFQTQQHARGSAQAELYPGDIDRFVIPLLDPDTQKTIGDLVRRSLAKQQESRQLLEQAKTRVVQRIEEAAQP